MNLICLWLGVVFYIRAMRTEGEAVPAIIDMYNIDNADKK